MVPGMIRRRGGQVVGGGDERVGRSGWFLLAREVLVARRRRGWMWGGSQTYLWPSGRFMLLCLAT
jgi:hypothetical protein